MIAGRRAGVGPRVDLAVSPAEGLMASPVAGLAVSREASPRESPVVARVVLRVIATSVVRRSVRPVVRQGVMVDNPVVKVALLGEADPVLGAHQMNVRRDHHDQWGPPSPKRSTSPTSTQLC